jgi:hypothetical protein
MEILKMRLVVPKYMWWGRQMVSNWGVKGRQGGVKGRQWGQHHQEICSHRFQPDRGYFI